MNDHVVRERVVRAKHVQHAIYHEHVRAFGYGIGNDLVIVEIDDRGEIRLAPLALEFRHVRACLLEAGRRMEVSLDQIRTCLAD